MAGEFNIASKALGLDRVFKQAMRESKIRKDERSQIEAGADRRQQSRQDFTAGENALNRESRETISENKSTFAEDFNLGLRAVESGEMTSEQLGSQFPAKRNVIRQVQFSSFSPTTQQVIQQIEEQLSSPKKGETFLQVLRGQLGELLADPKGWENSGVDVDAILKFYGVDRTTVESAVTGNSKGAMKQILDAFASFFGG